MTIKVDSVMQNDFVTFLSDVDVQYVSLVKHGANRVPFKILKSEKAKGGDMSLEVIHSIIQPSGADVMALKDLYPEWFHQVKLSDKVEEGDRVSFVQKSDEAFDDLTAYRFLDAGFGLEFKVGKLKRTEKADDALLIPTRINPTKDDMVPTDTTGATDSSPSANLNPDPMDVTIVEQPSNEPPSPFYPVTPDMSIPDTTEKFSFGDLFDSKLSAFRSAVVAAMELSEDPVTRRKVIQTFMKSFGNFLNVALDRVDATTTKSEDTDSPEITKDEEAVKQNDTGGFDMSDLFATKEELTKFIVDTIKATLQSENKKPEESQPENAKKSDSDVDQVGEINKRLDAISESLKGMEAVKAEVRTLVEKAEALSHGTGPRRSWPEDVKPATPAQKSESAFQGMFSNLQ